VTADRQRPPPTGSTSVAAVIGDPIAHSRSPAIFNAAFAASDLDWVYVAFPVAAGRTAAAVEGMRVLGLRGLSVTMPHKEAVIPGLDRLTPTAARLGAVNCIGWEGDALVGHNTDGEGFVSSLAAEGLAVAGRRCVVLGAGGAARSVVLALAGAGAAEVAVVNRTPERAEVAAALAGDAGVVVAPSDAPDAVGSADLLVNATPVGMAGDDSLPLPAEALHPGLFVAELVYHPLHTDLLAAAAAVGAPHTNGLGMLVHQAARAFEVWTGHSAPIGAMAAAAAVGPV